MPALMFAIEVDPWFLNRLTRHCEERSDEAIRRRRWIASALRA
jgi:hypothetical protein